MGSTRTVEDRLRAQYFELLPGLQRTLTAIETEVRYALLPLTLELSRYERILVKARLKECESAVDTLRQKQPVGLFDQDHPHNYSLRSLPDLVGVRVLTFPERRRNDVRRVLASTISGWTADPIPGIPNDKFHGYWSQGDACEAEIQIVPMLIGLFWEVEHSALYKASPNLRGIEKTKTMLDLREAVYGALNTFELEFDRYAESVRGQRDDPPPT